jgi:arylsulfatase A-like enzyme
VLEIREGQFRTLMAVDDLVGRLMATLGSLRERERTLVFFLSDNGYFWGEHGLIDKRMPYTEGITVPFLARWPGHVAAGVEDRRFVSLVDVAPTVLAATGTRPHPGFPPDGRSLLDNWERDRTLVEYFHEGPTLSTWASLVTAEYQYVEYYDEGEKQITFREYYDLNSDPFQLTNLLGDPNTSNDPEPSHLAALQAQLQHDRRCRGTSGPAACP